MRRLNRKVDRVACFGENDPNVTIGKVISVTDAAAGIDLSTATAFQVFAVQRTGNRMRLDCLGGAAGATGTVTSAIEQVCQDASFALPPDPSFSMPAISFPPVVGGVSIPNLPCEGDACGEENNPNACQDCACCATIAAKQARAACEAEFCAGGHESIPVGLSDWVDDGFGEMHEGPAGLRFEDTGSGHYEGIDVEAGRSFRLRCAFEFLANPVQVQFVLRDTVTSPGYVLWAELYVYGDGMDPGGDTLDLWVGDTPQPAGAHAAGANPGNLDDCVLVWEYDHAAATMTATLSIDGIETQAVSDSTTGGTAQQDPMWVGLQALSDGSTGSAAVIEINSLTLEYT